MTSHLRLRARDNIKLSAGTNVELLGPVLFSHADDANLAELKNLGRSGRTAGEVIGWDDGWTVVSATGGPTGPAGATGPIGPTGLNGSVGVTGPAGANGNDGAPGDVGPTGPAGADGANGNDGAPGDIGPTGAMGPAGADGVNGNDGSPGDVGPTGPAGADGANGNDGAPGDVGPTGPAGANGADGAAGDTGPTGPAGPDGALGISAGHAISIVDGQINVDENQGFNLVRTNIIANSYVSQYGASNTTLNDTPLPLIDQSLLMYDLRHFDVDVYAINSSTSLINVYNIKFTCKRTNGNVSIVPDSASIAVIEQQDSGIGGVSAGVRNEDPIFNAQLLVVGKSAETIQWVAYVKEFIFNND